MRCQPVPLAYSRCDLLSGSRYVKLATNISCGFGHLWATQPFVGADVHFMCLESRIIGSMGPGPGSPPFDEIAPRSRAANLESPLGEGGDGNDDLSGCYRWFTRRNTLDAKPLSP